MSDREYQIERNAGWGKLKKLKALFDSGYTQTEIDIALGSALAYSKIEIAKYLISLGADISYQDYDGLYYAVHNNEIDGLKFALSLGIDVNLKNGILLNTAVFTANNAKDVTIVKLLLENGADINLITENVLQVVEKFGTPELKEIIKNDT
jgi:ankyrin repeat protein